ncbi:InlB B-repeat-containing protein [Patulibacter minatonensis]|uniref:InlB B-repeat-containing protein n=1 Tax=Patulibacter minatonensis TaxID=298163 RepID=UPI0004B78F46|nr:SdrD B-like domain-containing protein [Patulibacter minatonensis]
MSPDMKHMKNVLRAAAVAAALGAAVPATASAATGSIQGTVTAAADGGAVSQYTVDLYGSNRVKISSVCTDGTGKYAFSGLSSGSYYVSYSGDPATCARTGYARTWYANRLNAKNATAVDVVDGADRPNIDAALQTEATISGTVTEAAGNAGLPGVSARVFDTDGDEVSRACTAANGTYRVHRLAPLPCLVQFVADPSCGPVGAYAARYYRTADLAGSETAGGASAVVSDYGQDKGGIDVRLALPGQAQRTLAVTVTGSGFVGGAGGGISCPGTCSATRPQGTVVTLTPTAAPGWTFTGWTGACAGAGACSVTLDGDKAVGATFATTDPGVPGGAAPGGGAGAAGGGTTGGGSTTPPVVVPPTTTTPTPGGSGIAGTKPKCSVAAPSRVKHGRFTVAVRCDRKAKLVVGGTVKLKVGRKTTTVKLATATSTATTKTVTIRLPAKAARALKAKAKLSAALTLRATTGAGTTTVGRKVARIR